MGAIIIDNVEIQQKILAYFRHVFIILKYSQYQEKSPNLLLSVGLLWRRCLPNKNTMYTLLYSAIDDVFAYYNREHLHVSIYLKPINVKSKNKSIENIVDLTAWNS